MDVGKTDTFGRFPGFVGEGPVGTARGPRAILGFSFSLAGRPDNLPGCVCRCGFMSCDEGRDENPSVSGIRHKFVSWGWRLSADYYEESCKATTTYLDNLRSD